MIKPTPLLLSISVIVLMRTMPTFAANETPPSTKLATITVYGQKDLLAPTTSEHDIYDRDESSTYKDQEDLKRFMGESPADIFKGMIGVESGDARNSGAIDPNVRGVQGQGRVPVTIDGTEQAITAYRGYQGASNRNYIDPLLISDVKVTKGATLERGIQSSVGGAVTINTLNVNDVLKDNANFGIDIKGVVGNNTTQVNAIDPDDFVGDNASNYSAELYPVKKAFANNPKLKQAFLEGLGKLPREWNTYTSPGLLGIKPEKNSAATSIEDTAYRIAVAGRNDWFDILAVYSDRNRGNYFAGDKGLKDYRSDVPAQERDLSQFPSFMADVYQPRQEVPNSSNQNTSYLLKTTFKPTDRQALQLGYRHTDIITGDILPARVADDRQTSMHAKTGFLPQWPLSNIDLDAYNLRYKWQPDNTWIDIDSNLWHTASHTKTHNSGGYPLNLIGPFRGDIGTPEFADYKQKIINQFKGVFPEVVNCADNELASNNNIISNRHNKCRQAATLYQSTFISNSRVNVQNDRSGISLSNKSKIFDNLDMTIAGNYQQEKLESENDAIVGAFFSVAPGKGRRKSGDASVNFDYRPTHWLDISAGVRYDEYWAMDDYVNEQRDRNNPKFINKTRQLIGYQLDSFIKANETVQQALADYHNNNISYNDYRDVFNRYYDDNSFNYARVALGEQSELIENGKPGVAYVAMPESLTWYSDSEGNFNRAQNPYFNGEAQATGLLRPAKSQGKTGRQIYRTVAYGEPWEHVPAQEAWGWSPSFSASVRLPWQGRLYGRYAQTYRMPSMFESIANFSKNLNHYEPVLPERGTNMEVGYIQDFSSSIDNVRFADIKLVYFQNHIDDVIDRDLYSNLRNFDEQNISGIEWQSRLDNGRYFGDFSAAYTLKNEVCDSDYAITADPYYGQIPSCVDQGFFGGFLFNMAQPKYMLNLTLGTRLLNEKLELGARIHHHSASRKDVIKGNYGSVRNFYVNVPYSWSAVTTLDYYLRYKLLKDTQLQLSMTNATNEYYLDPLSRTLIPAPGRAIHFGFETKF